ncbi:MAG: peptidylprolyl isomerase [Sphingobacteriaceae bacterium]
MLFGFGAFAQNTNTLMTVGSDKVSKQEFENVFKKNNSKLAANPDEKTLREYLDLYINFKLKVLEAKSYGMDTAVSFRKELAGYRKQLAAPYLTDKEVTEQLINEAYDRSKKEIRASHILINCKEDASAKDTLAAYNKIMAIRKKILEKKEDFGKVAMESSEDPSAKTNKGDLGFFSVFAMVYSFESACYKAKQGSITMPFRTKYGYHIVKVVDSRPAQGEVKVAHIMLRATAKLSKEDSLRNQNKINEVYKMLEGGQKFEELAKQYSEDKGSAKNGGILPVFGTGKMVPEFESEAFALKNVNDYSKPFATSYGWHIVKLIERKSLPTFDAAKADIKAKISRDSRADINKQSFIVKLKKEYKFTETPASLKKFYSKADSALALSAFKKPETINPKDPIFTIGTSVYTIADYADYLSQYQFNMLKDNMPKAKKEAYDNFVNKTLLDYEENKLDQKYPEFKTLMEEYRDGILLFELTDQKVWSAAVKDTAGLELFFEQNKVNYQWADRLDAKIYTCANEVIANDVRKLIKNKKISEDSLLRRINKTNPLNLAIKSDKFEKGENAIIDGIVWKKSVTPNIVANNTVVFVKVNAKLNAQTKALNEVRGTVTADYQNKLEKEWIGILKQKYPVQVDDTVFRTLFAK